MNLPLGTFSTWLLGLLQDGPLPPLRAKVYRRVMELVILASTIITMVNTVPGVWSPHERWVALAGHVALAFLTLDYGLRLAAAWERGGGGWAAWRGMGEYAASPYGVFDLLAVAPFLVGELIGLPRDAATVFGLMRFLKLARYSPALDTLGAVLENELRPLASALFIIVLLAIFTSSLLYFAEREVNQYLDNLPKAMWWSIVTLATLGYGDVVPITPLGKVLGSIAVVLGLAMFALPASILATGFAEEMRRQNFLSTWNMIAKVSLFRRLPATQIAEIAALLKPYRALRGETLVRVGDLGESMYFIVTGQVEVRAGEQRTLLRGGDFFGEIALVEQRPRTADVMAINRCQLLVLEARDLESLAASHPHLMATIKATAKRRLHESEKRPV